MAKTMPRRLLACLALAFVFSMTASNVDAAKKWTVSYYLPQWKTLHFDAAATAESRAKTLASLGCEAELHEHNGHTDLKYRQPKWTVLTFDTDEEAHKWQRWLNTMGFQTKHTH